MLGDRSGFSRVEPRVYFNHAAMTPPSAAVQAACTAAVEDFARRGVGAWMAWAEQRDRLRVALAGLVGAAPEGIGLVPNTSYGVVDVALSLPWRSGDRVVVFDGEFPTNVTPWQQAAARSGLEVVRLDGRQLAEVGGLEPLAAELGRGVRLVAVSAVAFQTGLAVPLRAIADLCHDHGAELFVDAIQAVGAVPIDVTELGIDYLACGGHKWLGGLEGTGFLYVRPDRMAALEPAVIGWLSHQDGARFLFGESGELRYDRPLKASADVFEIGVANSVGFAALEAAIEPLRRIGVPAIHDWVQRILDPLERGLVARGFTSVRTAEPEARSCILSVLPPHGVPLPELHAELAARGIGCATPDGHLRFSPHWANDAGQVDDVLAAVDAAIAALA